MGTPKFTVIIPTYQRNDLLVKCLDCLAPNVQTLDSNEYEVIVTDDGVLTTAEALVHERYPWAQWVSGPHRGPAANRNNGAMRANGTWILFTDDDCLPKPGWLQAYATSITPNVEIYEGKTICEAGIHSPLETAPINLEGGYLWSCNMMVSKRAFESLGAFSENFPNAHMEDVEFRERASKAQYKFQFIPEAVVDHPPRRLAWGNRLGAMAESEYILRRDAGEHPSLGITMLVNIIKTRLRAIRNSRIGRDTVTACISVLAELIYVMSHLRRWEIKYQRRLSASHKS